MEIILRTDKKGRILIPKEVRDALGIRDAVAARVEGDKLIIKPLKDPIDALVASVIRGTTDVEKEIRELRESTLKEAVKRLEERWP